MESNSDGSATADEKGKGKAVSGGPEGGSSGSGGYGGSLPPRRQPQMERESGGAGSGRRLPPSANWASVARGGTKTKEECKSVSNEELERLKEVFSETLDFPKEELDEAREEWRGKTLIGKFLGRRFDFGFVTKALLFKWKPKGDVEVIPTIIGFYIFRFACNEDLVKVRSGGPTMVGGAVLSLEEWRPAFKPNRDTITKATCWLRMPGLPLEFWKRKFVLAIASRVGRPIEIDLCTENMIRGGFARVCVEVDLTKPLVAGTPVGPAEKCFFQEFLYEEVGAYYFRCGIIGHRVSDCKCDPMGVKVKVAKIVDGTGSVVDGMREKSADLDTHDVQSKVVEVEETTELYGPWMSVSHNRRRQVPKEKRSNGGDQYPKEKAGGVGRSVAAKAVHGDQQQLKGRVQSQPSVVGSSHGGGGSRFAALHVDEAIVKEVDNYDMISGGFGADFQAKHVGSRLESKALHGGVANKGGNSKPLTKLKLVGTQNQPNGLAVMDWANKSGVVDVEMGSTMVFNAGENNSVRDMSKGTQPMVMASNSNRGVLKELNGRRWNIKRGVNNIKGVEIWDKSMSETLARGTGGMRPREPGESTKRRRSSSPMLFLEYGENFGEDSNLEVEDATGITTVQTSKEVLEGAIQPFGV